MDKDITAEAVPRAGWALRGPVFALPAGVIAATVLVQLHPQSQAVLEFDRNAILAGQWWRVLSCNLVHWSWAHVAGDLAAFALLWWLGQGRRAWICVMVPLSFVVVGLAICGAARDVVTYRGMSGANYTLLGWVLVRHAVAHSRRFLQVVCLGLLAAVAVKVAYEVVAARGLLGGSLPDGVTVVGAAHAGGLAFGALAAVVAWRLTRASRT